MTKDTQQTDTIWRRHDIDSPCINICVIHPETRLCTGCLRSIEEIATWTQMSQTVRAQVMADLPSRRAKMNIRRGGRAARLKRSNKDSSYK